MLVGWDMNQHLILCWVSQPNLPKLLTKCFASRKKRYGVSWGFALSLTLSHGKRGRITENPITVDFSTIIPSPAGRGDRLRKSDNGWFQRHYSLSPWERVRERAKRKSSRNVVWKRWQHKNTHDTNTQKKNIKTTTPKYVSDDLSPPKSGTRRLKSDFPDTSN